MGDEYHAILAWGTEQVPQEPTVAERSVGDLVAPMRPGSAVNVVNAVSRSVGHDAAGWRLDRLVTMVATLEREIEQVRN